jgi:dolichol-phosphate mannosyltransferase
MAKTTISVIIPAYNEEGHVQGTVEEVVAALGDRFRDYEIIIVDDGSKDRTGEIVDKLTVVNSHVRVLHNSPNTGFGYSYRRGVSEARHDYVAFFPGDDAIAAEDIAKVFDAVGTADIVSHYTTNQKVRLPARRIISRLYTWLMNTLFGLHLTYFNGPTIHRREVIQNVKISTSGFAFLSEIMVRLIRSGHSYVQIGTPIRERKRGSSKAFRPKNVASVLKTVCLLFWDVNVINRREYPRKNAQVL